MSVQRVAVVGAGLSGLATAVHLARRGAEVIVHEAAPRPGGMLQPMRFQGLDCDLGSHRLHPQALRTPLMAELGRKVGLLERPRRGRIIMDKTHIAYPMSLPGLLRGLGPRRAASFCAGWWRRPGLGDWERDRKGPGNRSDIGYEDFVTARVGRQAYEGFYRPYVEKVFGVDPRALSQAVAKKRLSSSRPWALLRRGAKAHYLYPRGGMAGLLDGLIAMCQEAGVTLRCNDPVGHLGHLDADAVVYTGPPRPAAGLRHRGLYLVFLALPIPRLSDVDTYYAPGREVWFGRVSELGNFDPTRGVSGEAILCVEIPEAQHGPNVNFVARLPELCDQLQRANILPRHLRPTAAQQRYLPNIYPIYPRGGGGRWRQAVGQIQQEHPRTYPSGRQGLFLHCNMDHCLTIAADTAAAVMRRQPPKAWLQGARGYLDLVVRD